jgi:cytochrome P450
MAALPPGPRLPAYLQTALLVLRPEATLRRWRRRYGDVFTARSLLSGRIVFLADPAATKDVFTGDHDVLRAGEANAFLEPVLGPRSVLLLDGREHLRQRRLLLPPFHGERMRAYEALMREAAVADLASWPVGRPFALLPRMQAITLDVIAQAVFGLPADDPEGAELRVRLRHMLEPMRNRLRLVLIAVTGGLLGGSGIDRAFAQRVQAVDDLLLDLIARRRSDPGLAAREDICALLLQATDADGEPMSDHEVRDELMTLLVAGHETTATALAWTFERLLRTPGVLDEARRSIDADDDTYLDAIVKEVLRLRPVVPNVARVLKADYRVGAFTLPAGAVVAPSIVLTHGREDLYPAARELRPERFLGEGAPDTYTWLPFGGGRRRCIGAAFAQTEIRVVLRTVLERTTLEAVGRRGERAKRNGVTLVPSRGARVRQRHEPRPPAAATASRAWERRTPAATR